MVFSILERLQQMKRAKYIRSRDKQSLLDLYHDILANCQDPESFKLQSSQMLDHLKKNKLTDDVQKQWLTYADSVFTSDLAVRLYKDKRLISQKQVKQAADYYRRGGFYKQVAALGLYACGQTLAVSDPMECYQLTKEAFTLYPELGQMFDTAYRYEGTAAQDHITEVCPICGSREAVPYYCSPQREKGGLINIFPPSKLWMKCSKCRNYYTYNFPLQSVDIINGHYTKPQEDETLQHRFPLDIYNNIFTKLRELTAGTRYLEIGVGNGEMLAVAQEFGYQAEAVEICREDCERISAALNVKIHWSDIVQYETEQQYDVIIMGDVFEHVTDPVGVLKKAAAMLKEDGVLWLSTPNYNCAYARMQKFTHCMWHELNHYTYVSYETMQELLYSLGMEAVHYDMSRRYIGSMELFIKKRTAK